jgi:LPS-assembly protein
MASAPWEPAGDREGVLPLQGAAASVTSQPTMRRVFFMVLGAFTACASAFGQAGTEKQPMEITASGETKYEDGLATAHGNVAIHTGDADIYANSATYNPKTHDIVAQGNVRIYRTVGTFMGDRAIYNTETKEIKAVDIKTDKQPYLVAGQNVTTISDNAFLISKGAFTTDDSDHPDFRLVAKKMRVYEGDRVIFQNVTFYVRNIPIFWWPYLYQSLDDSFSYMISPAYLSSWGPSILGRVTMPITEDIKGVFRLDYRYRRGVAVGFDPDIRFGADKQSWARIRTYFLKDDNPEINQTAVLRSPISEGRYRVSLQSLTKITDDIQARANITKLSDAFVLQDFFQGEFQLNPQPDNVVAVTKTNPNYTVTAIGRFQANNFFETTERLPEVVLDVKRQPVFGGPIFYEGETGVAELYRSFPNGSTNDNYNVLRLDSFHQFTFPNTFFGWLSIVPRIGFRATYYDETRDLSKTIFTPDPSPLIPDFIVPDDAKLFKAGNKLRTVFNGGVESSFKLSRTWDDVQSRALGLDGLKHVIQPFTNFSWVSSNLSDPASILQFDRYSGSSQLLPIDFPQFTSVDSIDSWTIWRIGVRNRLLTRRDDATVNWLDLETYFDVNFDNPFDRTQYSNLVNRVSFTPVPWMSFGIASQVPVEKGFTEVDTNVNIQPMPNLQLSFIHRYLNSSPFFDNSSLYVINGYYRIDDNWGVGFSEQYEGTTGVLEQQRYSVYRDLSSWVASIGAIIRDNGGVKEYGVLLTFTLKALPRFSFDLNFDPAGAEQTQ